MPRPTVPWTVYYWYYGLLKKRRYADSVQALESGHSGMLSGTTRTARDGQTRQKGYPSTPCIYFLHDSQHSQHSQPPSPAPIGCIFARQRPPWWESGRCRLHVWPAISHSACISHGRHANHTPPTPGATLRVQRLHALGDSPPVDSGTHLAHELSVQLRAHPAVLPARLRHSMYRSLFPHAKAA